MPVITCEHDFRSGALGDLQQPHETAGVDHARLVDDHDAAGIEAVVRQVLRRGELVEQAVEGHRGNPRSRFELGGGLRRERGAVDAVAGRLPRPSGRVEGEGLARAGHADDDLDPVSRTAQRPHHRRLFGGEVSPLREHRLEAQRVRNPAGSLKARTPEGEEARFGVQHLGGRVAKRTGERRDPRSRRAHEADDRMAVTGTVGCERPSGLVRDDEGNHGGIGEGVVGESFELGTPSALGAPLGPRDNHVVAGERGLCAGEPRRSDELASSCCHLGGSRRDAPVGSVQESRHAVTGHPERASTFGPGVTQLHELDIKLVASRLQTRRLARPWPRSTGALELRLDRVPSLREAAQHLAAQSPRARTGRAGPA